MTRLLLVLACLLAPSLAHAQELDDRSPRVAMNLALGFGGEIVQSIDAEGSFFDTRRDFELDASVGFDVRGELPVLDFLVVGGMFTFLSVDTDLPGEDFEREETFAFDGYLRGRWVFEVVADTLFVEPYVLLPLGFSMAVLPDDDGSGDDVWPGWNTGALLGAQVLHASGFGGYLEMGWRHTEVYHQRSIGSSRVDLGFALNEFALNLGFVYAFGG